MATASDSVGVLSGSIRGLAAAMRNVGLVMTATSAIAGAALFSMSMSAERVAESYREIASISSEVQDVQGEYSDLVSDLNTQFGTQVDRLDVLDGLYQSISAGVTEGADAQREFLETASQLAVVGLVDLETSVDVVSTMINAYGEDTDFAQRASEALFRTVQFGKVRLEELAPVMGRVTALGAEMGVEIEELGASMAVLTRTGFESRVAATGLRNVIRSMMKPSQTMQEILADIALEQGLFGDSMDEGASAARDLASDYTELTSRIRELESAQSDARETQEDANLAIQEARLKIQAIEEDRMDQLGELSNERVNSADSVEELESVVDDYRFSVNKARVAEEEARLEQAERESQVQDLRNQLREEMDVTGNLESGIGQMVLSGQGLVETLSNIQSRSEEMGIAMSEVFPRTRALQAALALVGEDASLLNDIFNQMREEGVEAGMETLEENRDELDMTQEEFENTKDSLKTLPELYEDQTGPMQEWRNSISQIKQSFTDLGKVFRDDVFEFVSGFADKVDSAVDAVRNMDEEVRSNISLFTTLAIAIGIVLGPILLVAGQLIIMASIMGTALIPFTIIAGAAFATFATAILSVLESGEDAESIISGMENFLSDLISTVKTLSRIFTEEVRPGMEAVGDGIMDLMSLYSDYFDLINDEFDTEGGFREFASNIGDALEMAGEFIQNYADMAREELMDEGLETLKVVVEGTKDLVDGISAVGKAFSSDELTQDEVLEFFKEFTRLSWAIIRVVFNVVGAFGRFLQRNDELIASILNLLFPLRHFIPLATSVIREIRTIGSTFQNLKSDIDSFISSSVQSVKDFFEKNKMWFSLLGGIIALFITGPLGALVLAYRNNVGGIADKTETALKKGAQVWKRFKGVVLPILKGTGEAVGGFVSAVKTAISEKLAPLGTWLKNNLIDPFEEGIDIGKQKGKNLIEEFISGMKEKMPGIKSVVRSIASTIEDYIGIMSNAEKGPLSNLTSWGPNLAKTFAQGIRQNSGKIESAFGSIDIPEPIADTSGVAKENGVFSDKKQPKKTEVNINEGAIYFESGAFQGMSDEELPEKVREEVDESLDEIIEDVRAVGADPE